MRNFILFVFIIVFISACTGSKDSQKEIQTFDSSDTIDNLLFQYHYARGGTKVKYFEENDSTADFPKISHSDPDGYDFTHLLKIEKSKIIVTSDSTIRFNNDTHELIKRTDSKGNAYYMNEEYTDSLKLGKSVIKIIRKNDIVWVFMYGIDYSKELGFPYGYTLDLYSRLQKAKENNDSSRVFLENRFKEVYEDSYVVSFIEEKFLITRH